ncbi:selenium-dependent molybdenum cofactor biosynthesis protein YqeB [Agathobacter sp.]|uniref:selenium-dependent molybdenum cofactor biosynthesis protein YqeB n=1 Tax=Agathobacter sp. TaxID=2021311 RepID=UPI003FD7A886
MSMNQSNNQIIKKNLLIICRGAGDLATGIIHRLHRAGHRVIALETDYPAAIRRQVSFCEAVYDGSAAVEGVTARLVPALTDTEAVLEAGEVPLLIDPTGESIALLKPDVVVDAIIAKKNLGTTINMAPLVIGVGPGFTAGNDVHLVIESMRGHNLARIITDGMAQPNTGVPGNIAGFTSERVIHAPAAGYIHDVRKIGDIVQKGDEIARIYPDKGSYDNALSEYVPVNATIKGIIRGLIREGYYFKKGFKIADIDPRESELSNCFTISDKARSIAGSVLEAVSAFEHGVKLY